MTDAAELACTYAVLILHDDKVQITADKINTLLTAANVTVQPFWPSLFARVLGGRNIDDLILNAGGGAPAPAPAAVTGPAKKEAEEKKEEDKGGKKKKEEPKEEEDDDMGLGLFD